MARHLTLLLLPVVASCTSTAALNEAALAETPPLPFRLAVVGGAFLPTPVRAEPGIVPPRSGGLTQIFSRTYPTGVAEPIELARVLGVLRRGRAATRIMTPEDSVEVREKLAFGDEAALARARRWAAAQGADLLLVIEGVREGPVELQGVTGQWPVTTIAWLLVGLGMFIPDHRFESKARLIASIRDVHSGAVLAPNFVVAPGPMDLALIDRTDFLGVLQSIIVPPSLVGNDVESVVSEVRAEGDRRIVLRLLARLKDAETLEVVHGTLPMRLTLRPAGPRFVDVQLASAQEVQSLAAEHFDAEGRRADLAGDVVDAFRGAFLAAPRAEGDGRVYRGRLGPVPAGEIRVLVQNVAGERVSSTIRVGS